MQCSVCGLWIHKTCANISDDGFKFLEEQVKNNGTAFWACRSCTAYANGMNHRMKEIEAKLDEVKETCGKNAEGLKEVRDEVGLLSHKVDQQNKKIAEVAAVAKNSNSDEVYEEFREREMKKLNVVMHGMGEAPDDMAGRDRWDWDIKSCENLFRALNVGLTAASVKFCRRLGERSDQPRPMVVGMHEERDKAKLLRCDTRKTRFSDIDIGPDLTKRQRQEESGMRAEAVKRNREISAEDRAKNLAWTVVGPRGERRLVKRVIDMELERRGGGGGQRRQMGGRVAPQRQATQSAAASRREEPGGDTADTVVEMEEEPSTQERPRAGRANRLTSTKRKEREGEEGTEVLPPAKH